MSGDDFIIETHGLTRAFAGFVAVNNINLRIRRGTIHSLIGPNGAGKTTCFNLITRFLAPTGGRIRFNGHDITRHHPAEVARRGMVRSFQISAVFPGLTVRENVRVALQRKLATGFHFWRARSSLDCLGQRAADLVAEVDLGAFADTQAAELSYGRKKALEIATTLALDPEMLLLDEPMAGMGIEDVGRTAALIRKVARDRTILMVEHNLDVVAELSDTITVLQGGKILAEGSYAEVSGNPQVIEAYMGTGHG